MTRTRTSFRVLLVVALLSALVDLAGAYMKQNGII